MYKDWHILTDDSHLYHQNYNSNNLINELLNFWKICKIHKTIVSLDICTSLDIRWYDTYGTLLVYVVTAQWQALQDNWCQCEPQALFQSIFS